ICRSGQCSLAYRPSVLQHAGPFLNDPATSDPYTLSLHDALPISPVEHVRRRVTQSLEDPREIGRVDIARLARAVNHDRPVRPERSEEHTSELQSRRDLVCRLLLENKKMKP